MFKLKRSKPEDITPESDKNTIPTDSLDVNTVDDIENIIGKEKFNLKKYKKVEQLSSNDELFFIYKKDLNEYRILEIFERHMLDNIFEKHLSDQNTRSLAFSDEVTARVRDVNVQSADTDEDIPVGTFIISSRTITHEKTNKFNLIK